MKIAKPFTNMALSLSGGGYRATTFHLGAMAYLHAQKYQDENLLQRVKIISTISGGTLTGVMYAFKLAKGERFQDCFDRLYTLLSEDKLVDQALHKLNKPKNWTNKHKSRDLINAFSEVYNEHFYDQATFGDLYNSTAENNHLTDAIFGASEFTYGIQFRFQEKDDNARFGNGYLSLPDEASSEIRLADATASSSCFPGGFEPMIMPHDYGNGPDSIVEKSWKAKAFDGTPYQATAIMDGGIIDNQGIEGVKLVEDRHAIKDKKDQEGQDYIGTYIVSDVCSEMMKPYKVPILEHSSWKDLFTLRRINISCILLFIVIVGLLFAGLPTWGIIASSVVLTLITIYFLLFMTTRKIVRSGLTANFGAEAVPELMRDFVVLLKTPIYILLYLVKFRLGSVSTMVSSLFLRRIRRLQLDSLYDDSSWNYRFKSNYIYALNEEDSDISPAARRVINMANNMPTTLWFTQKEKDEGMLDNLIAAGQITMCHNLIKYIKKIKEGRYQDRVWAVLSPEEQEAITTMETSMKKDWERFQEDPHWLLQSLKTKQQV